MINIVIINGGRGASATIPALLGRQGDGGAGRDCVWILAPSRNRFSEQVGDTVVLAHFLIARSVQGAWLQSCSRSFIGTLNCLQSGRRVLGPFIRVDALLLLARTLVSWTLHSRGRLPSTDIHSSCDKDLHIFAWAIHYIGGCWLVPGRNALDAK